MSMKQRKITWLPKSTHSCRVSLLIRVPELCFEDAVPYLWSQEVPWETRKPTTCLGRQKVLMLVTCVAAPRRPRWSRQPVQNPNSAIWSCLLASQQSDRPCEGLVDFTLNRDAHDKGFEQNNGCNGGCEGRSTDNTQQSVALQITFVKERKQMLSHTVRTLQDSSYNVGFAAACQFQIASENMASATCPRDFISGHLIDRTRL